MYMEYMDMYYKIICYMKKFKILKYIINIEFIRVFKNIKYILFIKKKNVFQNYENIEQKIKIME